MAVLSWHNRGRPPVSVRLVRTMRGLTLSFWPVRPYALLEMTSNSTFQMGSTAPAIEYLILMLLIQHNSPVLMDQVYRKVYFAESRRSLTRKPEAEDAPVMSSVFWMRMP